MTVFNYIVKPDVVFFVDSSTLVEFGYTLLYSEIPFSLVSLVTESSVHTIRL